MTQLMPVSLNAMSPYTKLKETFIVHSLFAHVSSRVYILSVSERLCDKLKLSFCHSALNIKGKNLTKL